MPTYLTAGYYISVTEYAQQYGVSVAQVRRDCAAQKLRSFKIGNVWVIRVSDG